MGVLRWPGTQRPADLPLVVEGVDDPTHPAAALFTHRSSLSGAGAQGLTEHGAGILDDEQCPTRGAADGSGAVALDVPTRLGHQNSAVPTAN
jgi:hypothetical protein